MVRDSRRRNAKEKSSLDDDLLQFLAYSATRPLYFVLHAFPWGEGELADMDGPDEWQREILQQIEDGIISINEAVRIAVASGHGVGKSCLVSWLILWAIATYPDSRGVVTANTESQLKTKTWAELAKWYRLFIGAHKFTMTATALFSSISSMEKTWRIDMVPWSIANTEAFAGLHNQGKRIILVFDEASAIPDKIWEVSEGALTDRDTEILWVAFGNPTQNVGRFRECFGRFKHRWHTQQVDSRTVKISNKGQIQQWIDDYGEDSDFVRVRVRGVFPRAGSCQFISSEIVEACRTYKAEGFERMPKILGVDVARFGDDQTVMTLRQGRKVFPSWKFRSLDTMQTADRVAELIREEEPDYVMIDGVGVGGGVVDRLRQIGYCAKLVDVNAGSKPRDDARYFNLRAEMWGEMRDALKAGVEIPDDPELHTDLLGPEYGFTPKQQIQLEKKQDIKKRGLASPDCADSLALTYSQGEVLPLKDDFSWRSQRANNWRIA